MSKNKDYIFIYWEDLETLKNKKNESKTNRKQTTDKGPKTK